MYPAGNEIALHFRHYQATAGLVDGDFTKALRHDGAAAAETLAVSEIGSGYYSAKFTPANTGTYFLDIVETADTAVRYQDEVRVTDFSDIADAHLDRTDGVETGLTPREAHRLVVASAAGKLSGADSTTIAIRDTNDTKDRITATVDEDGNRTAVTYDKS